MTYFGGVRSRLIRESLYDMVKTALEDLDWFDAGNTLLSAEYPLQFPADALDWDEEIQLNTLSLSDEDVFALEAEMGSNFTEERWTFALDFYAEDKAVGIHLINDLKTILGGRLPSIGRTDPGFMVKDYLNNGEDLFHVSIENIEIDRSRGWSKPWQKNWYFVSFDVLDSYGNEDDD